MANYRKAPYEKSLAYKFPELTKEWNYDKNEGIKPEDVYAKSNRKVWWKCFKGHEWEASVHARNGNGTGCPYCSNRYVTKETSIANTNPELLKEWHPTKNKNLSPDEFSSGSHKSVWWMCANGHEWQARIYCRTRGNGCPYCSGLIVTPENSLESRKPEIAKEWNYKKNKPLKPSDVSPNSTKRVWWKCKHGYEWESVVYNRKNIGHRNCPQCREERKFNKQRKQLLHKSPLLTPQATSQNAS